jgi:prepilin signal peptidase PulO-like enzyme (type II secretory pathway)
MILDVVTLPAIIIAFFVQWYLGESVLSLLLAGLIGGGFFLLQFLVSKGRWIGGGDIRLGVLMGFMLSYPLVIVALMISYFMGGILGMILMAMRKKSFGDKLPFGTFLALATVVTLLYGDSILYWYLHSFLR